MSEVLSEQSISPLYENLYSSPRLYVQRSSSSLIRNIESHFPERPKTGFHWETQSSASSMADSQRRGIYDSPSTGISDEYQRRQSLSQRTSREQLPPLSSIFQTSHTTTLPVRTPYPARSPNFVAVSPRTNLQTVAPGGEERLYHNASYEHRNYIQASQAAYSFDRRPEGPGIPHQSRTLSSGSISGGGPSQPVEPRYNTSDGIAQLASGNRWSPRAPESSSSDYFPRTTQNFSGHNKGYHDPRNQLPLASSASRSTDSRLAFGGKHFNTSPLLTPYQLSSSIVSQPEPSSTKDSLGPKIWTGTQFLPRFVKQQEVPGEGLCYFYDDGSRCKTVIDGEAVNAHWGVTKAGKPRKRLAIACITCREKKIKCDPDYPRCVQCEKFGRICKFKNAPRGANHGSPETTSPTETEDFMDHDSNSGSASHRADAEARRDDKDENESNHTKRRKNTLNAFTPVKAENEAPFGNDSFRHLSSASETSMYYDSLLSTWHTDPYEANSTLTDHTMAAYFLHINSGSYCMFPEQAFLAWLHSSSKKKSLDDHMLIYSMLALGTVFSGSAEHRDRGKEFARTSRYAVEHRSFSLQLVQSRLILSLYYLATADDDALWDFSGGAMRAASALNLNVEGDETEEMKNDGFPYDLTRHGYAECRRRTFWSLYIMDRLNSPCRGSIRTINSEDVYLRLPCDLRSFDTQMENMNPYFDISVSSTITSAKTSKLGTMAYLVIISSIWGDVMANIYRTSHRPDQLPPVSKIAYTNFHNAITKRLESWEASLPPALQYSTVNLDRSMREGGFGTFVTIHALYHITQIKLNRYHRPTDVSPSQLERNIRKAYTSARELLALADDLAASTITGLQRSVKPGEIAATKAESSNPFVGYAIVTAVNLVSTKGRRADAPKLLKTLDGARAVLKQLENFWIGERTSSKLVERRIEELEEIAGWNEERRSEGAIGEADSIGGGLWEMRDSIEKGFVKGLDGVLKAPFNIWFGATEGCKTTE